MKPSRWILLSLTGLALLLTSAYAVVVSKTFRTTALFYTFTQGQTTTTKLAGRNLVNLAMGRAVASADFPNQVLALTISCDYSAASLVVYDQTAAGIVATLASASHLDTVVQADFHTNRSDHVRFLAQFEVNPTGSAANGLRGGFLTVAGRIRANQTNGCPETVAVNLDYDRYDRSFGDQEVSRSIDPDTESLKVRAGLAHCVGVIDAVQAGSTNTLIIPFGQLSIRGVQP